MKILAAHCWLLVCLSIGGAPSLAQLTMAQAVEGALHNYPSVRVSQEQINAAAAGIRLARTAYLPRDRCRRASESRHPQQCLRAAAADAGRDSLHVRPGDRLQ